MENKKLPTLVIAIIGILADIIGIFTFIYSSNAQNNLGINISTETVYVVSHLILLYSWFVFAWYLSLKNFNTDQENGKHQRDRPIIRNSTVATGLILSPLSFGIESILYGIGSLYLIIFLLIGGIIVYESLKKILATFYPNMKKYFTRIGEYKCKKTILLKSDNKIFKEKKIIVVKEAFNEPIIYIPIIGFIMYMEEGNNLSEYVACTDTEQEFLISISELLSNFE